MKLTALQRQAIAEHSQQMQQAAQQEQQEIFDAVMAAAAAARKANEERQAIEDARIAELRAKSAAEQAANERATVRSRNPGMSDADFDRLYDKLRDDYLIQRSREQYIATRAEYSTIL